MFTAGEQELLQCLETRHHMDGSMMPNHKHWSSITGWSHRKAVPPVPLLWCTKNRTCSDVACRWGTEHQSSVTQKWHNTSRSLGLWTWPEPCVCHIWTFLRPAEVTLSLFTMQWHSNDAMAAMTKWARGGSSGSLVRLAYIKQVGRCHMPS